MNNTVTSGILFVLIILTAVQTGCRNEKNKTSGREGPHLVSGNTLLVVEKNIKDGYGIALYFNREDTTIKRFAQPYPLEIHITENGDTGFRWIQEGYSTVDYSRGNLYCNGTVMAQNGLIFDFTDTYSVYDDSCCFKMERNVTIRPPGDTTLGFASRFGLPTVSESTMQEHDFFAPGVWYGDNANVPDHAIAGDYNDEYFFFRETRLAAPFFMMMNRSNGSTLTIAHTQPDPRSVSGEYHLERVINDSIQFGSLGVQKNPRPMPGFLFPGSEGEKNYIVGRRRSEVKWAFRYHPIKPGIRHEYQILIKLDDYSNFDEALKHTWRYFFNHYRPPVITSEISKVYHDGVALLEKYCQDYNGTWGIPFAIHLDGTIRDIDFYMAFVGGQLLSAYHLINYGFSENLPHFVDKGKAVIDFWVDHSYDGANGKDRLPHTWYQPVKHARFHGGMWDNEKFWRPGPSYLRVLGEGHLAVLRAYRVMQKNNIEEKSWLIWIRRFGDWLCAHQNEDGSFYRAYEVTGEPAIRTKYNTTHAIPFLVELFKFTGNESYKTAALAAGRYSWDHIHLKSAYIGGTPDNPDVMDKEAALLAFDAFMALYDLNGESRWIDAAAKAATFAETWNYIWDIPMIPGDREAKIFDQINTAGLSLVATGHSYADYYNSFYSYQYYRLYLLTEDRHFYETAKFLLHNTKQLLDTDGSKGYGNPGLQTEGIVLAGRRGSGADVWLSWVTLAHIDPLSKLLDEFGTMDISKTEEKSSMSSSPETRKKTRQAGY